MATQLSPGVAWTEIDLTTIVPAVSSSVGAYAGDFDWGPIMDLQLITNEDILVKVFGPPSANTFKDFFTVANFLSYSGAVQVCRAANSEHALNATSGNTGLLISNRETYALDYLDLSADYKYGAFAAKYAGDRGNGLTVSVLASANTDEFTLWPYYRHFNGPPSTSNFVESRGGANDEMHIVVVDTYGKFTGVANTILEKFSYVSKAIDAKNDDGSSNYYVNVLEHRSDYVYAINHPLTDALAPDTTNWGTAANNKVFSEASPSWTNTLLNGDKGAIADAEYINGYLKFLNAEDVDVSLIMCGPHSTVVSEYVLDNIVGVRKDCVAFVSPLFDDVVDNRGNEVEDIILTRNDFESTSYGVMDCGWKYQYDKYNSVYRWVPLNGDIAGLCARTDYDRDPWFSPAGFNRGHINNVVKLSWNPSHADRDELYKNGINPVVNFKGEGVVLYGDKTMQSKPSAFDRINVRRLFIVLEKAITKAAKYSLFEFNDAFTRSQFVALVEPYLRDVKGRRGIYDFKVVCDESNNTPEIIDRNEFVGDIYIKPARTISFIQLNFVAVRTGVQFSEIVGKW